MLRTLIFSGVITAFLVGGLANPFFALLGYVWFALFRPQEWVWIDISAFRFSLVLGVLLLVRSAISGYVPTLTHRHALATLGIFVAACVAHLSAVRPDVSASWLDYFARLGVVTMLVISLVDSEERIYWLITTIALSFGFHTAKAGLASILGGGVKFADGLAGAFVDNNGYAIGAVMVMPLLWATARLAPAWIPWRRFYRLGFVLAVPLSGVAVISTFSRSGFLALCGAALAFVLLHQRRFSMLVSGVVMLGLAYAFVPIPKGYFDRIETIRSYEDQGEASALSRLHFWRVALVMVSDHPLGVGFYNFEPNYDAYDWLGGEFGTKRSVHSSHLQMLTETGVIGFLLWAFLFVSSFYACLVLRARALRAPPGATADFYWTVSTALLISMGGFALGGMFISMALNDLTWITFGLIAAVERVAAREMPERVGEFGARVPPPDEAAALRRLAS